MLVCAQVGMIACAESEFDLAPDSRLPRWVNLPETISRRDVSVRLSMYRPGVYRVRAYGSNGSMLDEQSARVEGKIDHTELGGLRTGNVMVDIHPIYEVLSVKGDREIIEFAHTERSFTLWITLS